MSLVRVRQHVNPLAIQFQQPIDLPDWSTCYDRDRPLHLDIGCARGRFIEAMAQTDPHWNYLGLEIRKALVDEANRTRDSLNLRNLHYLFCNANVTTATLLQSLPPNQLQRISIQFPDPWFKKKHHKRRVVQPELVETIATCLPIGGTVFLQSDVLEIETEMCSHFAAHPGFARQHDHWLPENPLPVQTEREISCLRRGLPIYRAVFDRV
jgi:tRNA (guanine-N7-)-methyltransferase